MLNRLCHAYNAKQKFELPKIGILSVLMVDASHVPRYWEFARHHKTERKFNILFDKCYFLGVRRTDWVCCLHHFQGLDLEGKKAELGDQWQDFHSSGIKPDFSVMILGSSSLDSFDKRIRAMDQHINHRDCFWRSAKTA